MGDGRWREGLGERVRAKDAKGAKVRKEHETKGPVLCHDREMMRERNSKAIQRLRQLESESLLISLEELGKFCD